MARTPGMAAPTWSASSPTTAAWPSTPTCSPAAHSCRRGNPSGAGSRSPSPAAAAPAPARTCTSRCRPTAACTWSRSASGCGRPAGSCASASRRRTRTDSPAPRSPYNPPPPRLPVAPAGAFAMPDVAAEAARRRTFAIISHPDAGKTTLTEKLLLFGGAIQMAGSVKSRKTARHATSDWMALEKERGISVTSSVMQFPYEGRIINLLDTPGHADFGEDTYRVLTAVDSALMVIDVAKGVEERTIKLMEVCRMRDTPIMTFINKLDREGKDPIELLDEVESVLRIQCAPVTWPIGMGKRLKGVVHLLTGEVHLYEPGRNFTRQDSVIFPSLDAPEVAERIGADMLAEGREQLELVEGAAHPFDLEAYLAGRQTPVFFGSAVNNFGVQPLLDFFVEHAPPPRPRATTTREVQPHEQKLTGFVFKIQANMDPQHRDRVAFMRICSGHFTAGMKAFHVRSGKEIKPANALTFMASDRELAAEAWPGDVIGIHNHGTIAIGDTFTEGEVLSFTGIPNFAPELFRRARLRDPLKLKQLQKGLA